eukprot:GHVP01024208.1.p1 GENE.GHVP01024208.1~~GHVP01024208.1.p1  ORF type:complete len:295 (-),score=34.66 GHVP01024208.1:310-1194(-)
MSSAYVLTIDQGTTSTRVIIFDKKGSVVTSCQKQLNQYFPADGFVEHDCHEIWNSVVELCREAVKNCPSVEDIKCMGITNQRETTIVWNRHSGVPIHRAIVWQDRRTSRVCEALQSDAQFSNHVILSTGLIIDPYFSATKVHWLLENIPNCREAADRGDLLFGTIDTFLLWKLTGGKSFKTEATNASRTMMFDIHKQKWDDKILEKLGIPKSMLPEVENCSAYFGEVDQSLFGKSLPITGIAGDQHSALFGQCCFKPGMGKSTFGTGSFAMINQGKKAVKSTSRLLTTVAYRLK